MTGRQKGVTQSRGKGTGAGRQKPGRKEGKKRATEVNRRFLGQSEVGALFTWLPGARRWIGLKTRGQRNGKSGEDGARAQMAKVYWGLCGAHPGVSKTQGSYTMFRLDMECVGNLVNQKKGGHGRGRQIVWELRVWKNMGLEQGPR